MTLPMSFASALALLILVGVGSCDFCDSPAPPPVASATAPHSAGGPAAG